LIFAIAISSQEQQLGIRTPAGPVFGKPAILVISVRLEGWTG
jgi:hypothetical protein